jgi:hypothetical protein
MWVDTAGAHMLREAVTERLGDGTLTITTPDGTRHSTQARNVVLAPASGYVEAVYGELQRRRRSRLTDDDYVRVADVYRHAVTDGRSAQHAVKDTFTVSQSRAATMIAEARKRGLLPPTTRGKAQA